MNPQQAAQWAKSQFQSDTNLVNSLV
jgi:hypothetical protein